MESKQVTGMRDGANELPARSKWPDLDTPRWGEFVGMLSALFHNARGNKAEVS